MYLVDNDFITRQTRAFHQACESHKAAPLMYENFVSKVLPSSLEKSNAKFPMEIRLPKDMKYLLQGDFEPERIITLDKPITRECKVSTNKKVMNEEGKMVTEYVTKEIPIWFNSSLKGVYLRFGYKNGDSRYPSMQRLDDGDIHMIFGGATGQGKSVALNHMIFTMCEEYAPWEICLTMCDSKIVEFKNYAQNIPLPHIQAVAATGDADYLISVLEDKSNEMKKLNSVFAKAKGSKKLEEFRKNTGLCYPRHIIIIDEFQVMFKNAGKKLNKLINIIDDFARLGRNTGYHLIMASQEIGSDIPPGTLANIKIRGALGCTPAISETILGNDEAKDNYGKKGRLLVNTNPSGGKKEDNVLYIVPFLPEDEMPKTGGTIIEKGKENEFKYTMTFYDEQEMVYESKYADYLKKFAYGDDRILLGEPSYVTDDPEKIVKLIFTGKDIENIMVLANGNSILLRFFTMLKKNFEIAHKNATNWVLCADNLYEDAGARDLVKNPMMYVTKKVYEDNPFFIYPTSLVVRRKLLVALDKAVFEDPTYDSSFDKFFYSVFEKGSPEDTELFKIRAYNLELVMEDKQFAKLNPMERPFSDYGPNLLKILFKMCHDYGTDSIQNSYDHFPVVFMWLLGQNKIIGLGRDSKGKQVEEFKQTLQDSSEVNIRFIIFTTELDDDGAVVKGIRWFITDNLDSRQQSKLKCQDYYPPQSPAVLAVLYDQFAQGTDKCFKFKKMAFDGEILG